MLPLQRENVHRLKTFLMLNKQEMHLFGKIQGILHADKGKPLILWEYLCTVGTVIGPESDKTEWNRDCYAASVPVTGDAGGFFIFVCNVCPLITAEGGNYV